MNMSAPVTMGGAQRRLAASAVGGVRRWQDIGISTTPQTHPHGQKPMTGAGHRGKECARRHAGWQTRGRARI